METQTPAELRTKKCLPCEGGVQPYSPDEAREQLAQLTGWRLSHQGQRIRKDWTVKNFLAGMAFFNRCAELAEADGHHPDLHIEGYRHVSVELWTHAIGGLSENDFILAAKIDALPVELRGQ
ncbi:MAG TPA: 4a-hydroxytetrahydrobiopterin dehydratase [Lacipirellulaceae bacterium]|nr:4a-hydroxytetrahydrobiopterin dehydratase [Lacipirellulaceae bacterium]